MTNAKNDQRHTLVFSGFNHEQRSAYYHGRCDAEIELMGQVRRARDSVVGSFFWGLMAGALIALVVTVTVYPS
jgi:hypothetical protein